MKITISELAKEFIGWGDDMQAELINEIGKKFKFGNFDEDLQIQCFSKHINSLGKKFILTISKYLEKEI